MIIGGVDLGGRKAAISLFDSGELTSIADLEVPKSTRARELRTLAHWSWTHLKVCDAIFVEEPLVGKGVRASLQIAHTAGAVLSAIAEKDHIYFVPVSSWKKEVVGSGNAGKPDITAWLRTNYPRYASQCGGNQDKVDAICIGLYGVAISDRARSLEEL